jgi:hypothetical protein
MNLYGVRLIPRLPGNLRTGLRPGAAEAIPEVGIEDVAGSVAFGGEVRKSTGRTPFPTVRRPASTCRQS